MLRDNIDKSLHEKLSRILDSLCGADQVHLDRLAKGCIEMTCTASLAAYFHLMEVSPHLLCAEGVLMYLTHGHLDPPRRYCDVT